MFCNASRPASVTFAPCRLSLRSFVRPDSALMPASLNVLSARSSSTRFVSAAKFFRPSSLIEVPRTYSSFNVVIVFNVAVPSSPNATT